MTDDIWDTTGIPLGGESDEEGWSGDDSDSETPSARCAKRKRAAAAPARKTYTLSDDDDDPLIRPSSTQDDEEDFLDAYVLTAKQQQQQQQKKQKRSSKTPDLLVLDSDSDAGDAPGGNGVQPKASSKAKGSAAAVIADTAVLSEPARAAAERAQRMKEQLEQAMRAGSEELDDEQEEELTPPAKQPRYVPPSQVEDLTLDEEDIDALLAPGPGSSAAAQPGGDEGRLPLLFKTEKGKEVTVRIRPTEPLAEALDKFREYVQGEGWGTVSKFMFDGEILTGEETADGLGLEADDVIEVYQ